MDHILDGVAPVNGGQPVSAPTQTQQPGASQVPATPDASKLETARPLEPVQQTPTQQPAPVQPAPEQPVQAPVPVQEPESTPSNFFDPNWKFAADLDDTPADRHLGRVLEKHQINGEALVKAVYNGTLSAADEAALKDSLGDHYEYTMETVNHRINQGIQQERQRIFTAVGGEQAWQKLSEWAGDKIDASKKAEVNGILKRGGLQAELLAQSLMSDFNQYASEEEKQQMGLVINATKAGATPNTQQPAQPAPLMQGDTISQPAAAQAFEPIYSARELAKISSDARRDGIYTPQFEDYLAARLKNSKQNGVYKRISVETPAPADLKQKLKNRI